MTRKLIVFLAAALALPAMAQESLEERLRACADETDDDARLACFDKASRPPAEPAPVAVEAAPAPKPAPKPVAAEAAPITAAPTAAAPAQAAPAPPDPVDEFGQEADKSDDVREISAIVVEVGKRSRGQYVITLDNGQVWTEKDAEPYLRIKVGDKVRIKRIAMGGYRLVGRGNRASAVVRLE